MDLPSTLPRKDLWYQALQSTPFDSVKCVILGQDPYHTKGMAHGLAFSVLPHWTRLPPTLQNIHKEYVSDLGYESPRSGCLRNWAERGVLLLNTSLTVEQGKADSHAKAGWSLLCYETLRSLHERGGVVFNLWGSRAQEYEAAVRGSRLVSTVHPSPLSAHRGWYGSKPFSKTNTHLKELNIEPIDWKLT